MHGLRLLWAAHYEDLWLQRHRRNISRHKLDKITEMQDTTFVEMFRLNKDTFCQLCRDLHTNTSLRGTRMIPLQIKVLCTLSFLANGSHQKNVGVTQHLPQQTASRCIRQVIDALNSPYMLRNIELPDTLQERSRIRQEFLRKFNLPGVVGCIDCTHVAISKPGEDEHLFFNNKGYHSLNVQIVCDHNMKILNVNSQYGGATQDSFILESSPVEQYMCELTQSGEEAWLLGDSEYPLRDWLMTPVLNAAPGSREEIYTARQTQARSCIEKCIGILKSRWKCLQKPKTLHYHPQVASQIVNACCVLHNIALQADQPLPEYIVDDHDTREDGVEQAFPVFTSRQDNVMQSMAIRDALINSLEI